jgi:hypothetical protein
LVNAGIPATDAEHCAQKRHAEKADVLQGGSHLNPHDRRRTFHVQGGHDALVRLSGCMRTLAVSLYKVTNDIRLMFCRPPGFADLIIPENKTGSPITPGKVNPTQAEALEMVSAGGDRRRRVHRYARETPCIARAVFSHSALRRAQRGALTGI